MNQAFNTFILLCFFIIASTCFADLTTRAKLPESEFKKNNLRGAKKIVKGYGKLNVKETVKRLQAKYKNTKSFKAEFEQNFHQSMLKKTATSQGIVYFKKPGQMRWNYEKPSPKEFIVNKDSLIIYNAKDKSAYENKCFKQNSLTSSLSFLWGMGDLDKKFNAKEFNGRFGDKSDLHIRFKPKEKNTYYRKIILVLDPKTYQIKQSIIVDLQNNVNQFIYNNFKTNVAMPQSIFDFKKPKGVSLMPMPGTCAEAPKTPKEKHDNKIKSPALRGTAKKQASSFRL